jgi:hypothetical protein
MFGCGQCPVKVFLYNFMQVTWQENWQKCCALGMKTVSLNKYYSSVSIMDVPEGKFSLRKFALLMLKKTRVSQIAVPMYSFWTGGTRKGCSGQYTWCYSYINTYELSTRMLSEESHGACVLAFRFRGSTGDVEFAVNNEVCTEKAFLACNSQKYPLMQTSEGKSEVCYFDTLTFCFFC